MGAILANAWGIYRRNFLLLTAVMLTVWIPAEFFVSWMTYNVFGEDDIRKTFQLSRFMDNFVGIIAISGVFYIIREREAGRPVSFGGAFLAGFRFWGPMFATRFIVGVGIVVGLVLLIIPGLFLTIRLILAELAVVEDETYGFAAAKRSNELVKGHFWRTVGTLTVGMLPVLIIALLIVIVPVMIPGFDSWIVDAVSTILADIPMVFAYPLLWAVYQDLAAKPKGETVPQLA